MLCFTFVGCGGGGSHTGSSDQAAIGEGSKTATCTEAMLGAGGSRSGWRQLATSVSGFGVFGGGRDFRTAQKQGLAGFSGLQARQVHGPILVTKTPFVVEGTTPVTVAIVRRDRPRAGLVAGHSLGGPYAEIRLVPCRDQPRTWWPAGWVLRDQGQVTVSVHRGTGSQAQLVVGRP
jgi:hypothetical protein